MSDLEAIELRHREEYAAALRALRAEKGVTQQQAADAAGISLQAWQNYEYARRKFTQGLKQTVTRALDASIEDLERHRAAANPEPAPANDPQPSQAERAPRAFTLELPMLGKVRAGPKGMHVYDPGEPETIDFSAFFGPDARVLQLGGESMVPYAEPGGFVTYNLKRGPQRNKGCVIVTRAGEYYVKRYDGIDDDGVLHVTELHPVERQIEFDMKEIEGVYLVGIRIG